MNRYCVGPAIAWTGGEDQPELAPADRRRTMARAAIPPTSFARLIAGKARAKTGLLTLADGIADCALFRAGIS